MSSEDFSAHTARSFSIAAHRYDRLAHVQQHIADRLVDGLAMLGTPNRILDVGCGTGSLTRRLAALYPAANITGVDIAPGMIQEAKRQTADLPRIRFETANAARYRAPRAFDLLVSSSTLHWIQPLERAIAHLAELLEPMGAFAFAIMLDRTLWELHEARNAIAPNVSPRARMPTAEQVRAALASAGFSIHMEETEELIAHADTAVDLLKTLKGLGVTGGPLSLGERPLSRGELQRLCGHYETHHRDAVGVHATYRAGYFWGTRDV